jgi:hypothetical protein
MGKYFLGDQRAFGTIIIKSDLKRYHVTTRAGVS